MPEGRAGTGGAKIPLYGGYMRRLPCGVVRHVVRRVARGVRQATGSRPSDDACRPPGRSSDGVSPALAGIPPRGDILPSTRVTRCPSPPLYGGYVCRTLGRHRTLSCGPSLAAPAPGALAVHRSLLPLPKGILVSSWPRRIGGCETSLVWHRAARRSMEAAPTHRRYVRAPPLLPPTTDSRQYTPLVRQWRSERSDDYGR